MFLEYFLPGMAVLAMILALLRSRAEIRLFFAAQLLATVVGQVATYYVGYTTDLYRYLYIGYTLVILETCLFIIASANKWNFWKPATFLALLVGCLAAAGTILPKDANMITTLAEAILVSVLGFMLLYAHHDAVDKRAVLLIGVFCIIKAICNFMYLTEPLGDWVNTWLPAAAAFVCFGVIAVSPRVRFAH